MLKNWYAICDNDWIFDNKIKSELPLLLYISSLTAEKGYCFAGNFHLASKLKIHETSVSKKIKKLSNLWYINLEYKYRWCEVIDRKIRLAKTPTVELQKCQSTISKNTKDNITSINNTSNNNSKELQKNDVSSELSEIWDYWDTEINAVLTLLYRWIWIDDFKESKKWQRIYWKHFVNFIKTKWKEEFIKRLKLILDDDFKVKNCNSIKYLYWELKSFIHSPIVWINKEKVMIEDMSTELNSDQKRKLREIAWWWKEKNKHKELTPWILTNMINSVLWKKYD